MFTVTKIDEFHQCMISCSCGCQEVLIKTRTQDMNPYVFHENIKQVEYYECPQCGATELKNKPIVPVLMGPQNFASRQGPQAQWICACKKKVRYVNHGESCKNCGNTQDNPFQPKAKAKVEKKKVVKKPSSSVVVAKSWEVKNPDFVNAYPD